MTQPLKQPFSPKLFLSNPKLHCLPNIYNFSSVVSNCNTTKLRIKFEPAKLLTYINNDNASDLSYFN